MARLEGARLGLAMRIIPAKYFVIRVFLSLGTPVNYRIDGAIRAGLAQLRPVLNL